MANISSIMTSYEDAREDGEYLAALARMGDICDDSDEIEDVDNADNEVDNADEDVGIIQWSPSYSESSEHTYATVGFLPFQ